ncbi:MAG: MotA/TolQ/ExbB proton channel family protein [Desulfobacterales bacterium]|nr:MotA/TolQ/ExbB proton channel family protein [Desulfobacterales bacterium]
MNINIFKIIAEADIVVQFILLLLVFFSVFSWAIIFYKAKTIKSAVRQSDTVPRGLPPEQEPDRGQRGRQAAPGQPAGRHLPGRQQGAGLPVQVHAARTAGPATKTESLSRALLKASNAEVARLEKMMFFLATTGSVSPFIGLFGTVWGIMISFVPHRRPCARPAWPGRRPGHRRGPRSPRRVGLFAAVPGRHRLQLLPRTGSRTLIADMEDFSLEFLSIAERLHGS